MIPGCRIPEELIVARCREDERKGCCRNASSNFEHDAQVTGHEGDCEVKG